MALKNIKKFVKEQNINPNETQAWKDLIKKIIKEYNLKSKVTKGDQKIKLAANEKVELEKALYYVEDDEITLNYIFEGNIEYI